jgi:hypothetical protein
MKTYKREFETYEAFIAVLVTGDRYTFIKQSYNDKQSLATAERVKVTLNKGILDSELIPVIENTLSVTNCYDLNDWKVI